MTVILKPKLLKRKEASSTNKHYYFALSLFLVLIILLVAVVVISNYFYNITQDKLETDVFTRFVGLSVIILFVLIVIFIKVIVSFNDLKYSEAERREYEQLKIENGKIEFVSSKINKKYKINEIKNCHIHLSHYTAVLNFKNNDKIILNSYDIKEVENVMKKYAIDVVILKDSFPPVYKTNLSPEKVRKYKIILSIIVFTYIAFLISGLKNDIFNFKNNILIIVNCSESTDCIIGYIIIGMVLVIILSILIGYLVSKLIIKKRKSKQKPESP